MGTLVSSTSRLLRHWRQLDPLYRRMIAWLTVFLLVALSIMVTLDPSGDRNTLDAASTSTTTTPWTEAPVATQTFTVAAVVDGRTITGSDGEEVIVEDLGLPGPCWAQAALDFAQTTLLGKQVRVDADIVWLPDGEDFAVLMAGRGHGRMKAGARTAVSDAQQMAKLAGLGLWGAPCSGSDTPPPSPSSLPADTTPAPPPPAVAPPVVAAHHEAETPPAVCIGTIDTNWPGYSGAGFCNTENAFGSYAQFTVTSSTAGPATVVVRFANGSTAGRPADLLVNGTKVQSAPFEVTGDWSAWFSKTLTVTLPSGSSTIRLVATTADGLPNIDHITTTPTAGTR